MSKSRGKKQKKKSRKEPQKTSEPTSSSASPATSPQDELWEGGTDWYLEESKDGASKLYALKVQFLGPFLFGQQTLCVKTYLCLTSQPPAAKQEVVSQPSDLSQAFQAATEHQLLPAETGLWPMFFERKQWQQVQVIVKVINTTVRLCETNQSFREYTVDAKKGMIPQDDNSLAELVQLHSDGLIDTPLEEVEMVFTVVRIQVAHFAVASGGCRPGEAFLQTLADKEQLVGPVKERGNANFKELRYRAAIADYSRAIKLCPYSPILFCNRALCYLRNGDLWCACVDSYRALVLRPGWEKAYFRCAEAWARMGELSEALAINQAGLRACSDHSDLDRQLKELQGIVTGSGPTLEPRKPDLGKTASPLSPTKDYKVKDQGLGNGPPSREQSKVNKDSRSSVDSGGSRSKEKRGKKTSGSTHNTGTVSAAKKQPADTAAQLQPSKKTVSSLQPPMVTVSSQPPTKTVASPTVTTPVPATPYTKFEPLSVPIVSWEISTQQLLQSCQEVQLQFLTPAIYTQHSSAWESLEPPPRPTPQPTTIPGSIRDPMLSAQFDEIWCPILADSKESGSIIPPLFHYLPPQQQNN